MKNLIFGFFILLNIQSYAQFNSVIFSKYMSLSYGSNPPVKIYRLGDQNADGYDDIMVYSCTDETGYIYFGGNPMDTIPDFSIRFFYQDSIKSGNIALIDINDDGVKDFFVTSIQQNPRKIIRIFYGGSGLDSIPDIMFHPPPGVSGFTITKVLNDFNGDGRSEIILFDPNLPYSSKQFGSLYFYNTESTFDTIPHYTIFGDSVQNLEFISAGHSSGDLNGDGKTDLTLFGWEMPDFKFFRYFYLGNESFELEPDLIWLQAEHTFNVQHLSIINDIDGDGRDDILMIDYGFYPYYYYNIILKGSFPIDTIPDYGLNTQNQGINASKIYPVGDVNGDGYNDIFAPALNFGYTNAKLWVGGRDMPYTLSDEANKTWFGNEAGFGRIISDIGDVDGDSVNDLAFLEITYSGSLECKPSRVYIFKGDTSVIGDTGTVSVNDAKNIMPQEYELNEPYPNPFNSSTIISWYQPEASLISLKLFDILGNEVASVINEFRQQGNNQIRLNLDNYKLSSGIYFITLKALKEGKDIFRGSKKLLILK